MAFHGAMLPNLTAATTELIPSVANFGTMPWRPSSTSSSRRSGRSVTSRRSLTVSAALRAIQAPNTPPPNFIRNIPSQFRVSIPGPDALTPTLAQDVVSAIGRPGLLAANPTLLRATFRPQVAPPSAFMRLFTPASTSMGRFAGDVPAAPMLKSTKASFAFIDRSSTQKRGFGTSNGISRSQLASMEESANRNPGNANAQNGFYQLLLRANMPGIIVERYQSGRFARNAAVDEAYRTALAALNAGAAIATNPMTVPNDTTAQNISRGVAPQSVLPQAATTSAAMTGSRGVKGEPVYVVVDQPTSSVVFRWFKFVAWFLLFTYLSLALLTILIETFGGLKRGAMSKNDAEVAPEKQTTRFSDVHGCDEAKEELQEVVEFLRNPEKFSELGAKLPKGVLLVGPPGTGKTLLAKAVAGEAGTSFFYMSGSEFDEIFVGVGAKRVRDLFAAAKAKSPAIVFIDELDAVGGKRSPKDQAHAKQTLNQLLTELDGFDKDTQIVIMGATNFPESLDKALTRPGRFDRHINVDLPEYRGRLAILQHHAKRLKLAADVDLAAVASRSAGKSGAELENLLNIAALRASRFKASAVTSQHMEWAFDRITMGAEKKSRVIRDEDKEITAYHEAGHALVQLLDKDNPNNLYKVTILPKGPSLGHTAFLPQMDKTSYTMSEFLAMIRTSLGGKMAEELIFGNEKATTGVSADLQSATHLAFSMLTQYGMSNSLGPVGYADRYENLSSETKAIIEREMQQNLKNSYEDVRKILTDNRNKLELLAKALVEYETLDKAEVEKVIRGEKLLGRPKVLPRRPITLPLGAGATQQPGLDGIGQPQPPSEASQAGPTSGVDA